MNYSNLLDSSEIRNFHFIGIGGSSMSGLAEILLNLGYKVTGSDERLTAKTQKLQQAGAEVFENHSEHNIQNPDVVVYTAAIKQDNPELVKARSLNIPVIERSTLLGLLMRKYPYSIGVSGTHGKTTTTSMISMIMLEDDQDPSIHIGGELSVIGGGTRIGNGDYFITEACEYVDSFLKFFPYTAVILNIEADHLDYFKDINQIKASFTKFASLVPENGFVVACADDENVLDIIKDLKCKVVTYGLRSVNAQWEAKNISYDENGCGSYTLVYNNECLADIKLSVPGTHNISNSLAAAATCYNSGCSISSIISGLLNYQGAQKRFEVKGLKDGIKVVDDYAHHPTEIKATLKAATRGEYNRIWCVFQPHTYSRMKALLDDFAGAFGDAYQVIVTDIYAAREVDKGEIHASALVERLKANGTNSIYLSSFRSIVEYLNANAAPRDLIITMGAGDVCKVGEMFLEDKKLAV